jgi:site-specific DNA-methyltransferase (adenine-specific)
MNSLYYGDNLDVLRASVPDASVDLVYLDPPFNSQANYNVLFRAPSGEHSQAQIQAFEDTWHWNESAEKAFDEVLQSGHGNVASMLQALRAYLGENDMMAYLTMMCVRLLELHRVLKDSGALYLHCDPTASHYLKILLDGIFGIENYCNEIIWRRTGSHNKANRFGPVHDVIHFYRKSKAYKHRPVFRPYLNGHVEGYFKKSDERGRYWTNSIHGAETRNGESGKPWNGYDPTANGRHWAIPSDLVNELGIDPDLGVHEKLDALNALGVIDLPDPASGSLPTYRQYLHLSPGVLLQDIWAYQPHTRGVLYASDEAIDEDVRWLTAQGDEERLGYPTQKPEGLLERIIRASTREGDVVLDPFCGCGTTIHAAQNLSRSWIGIDITHLAISLIDKRLKEAFPGIAFETHGTPKDAGGARALAAQDKYQFQWWAVSLVNAVPFGGKKKGADGGIDGLIYFKPDGKKTEKAIVSVKGGDNVSVSMIRDLAHVVEREKAKIGVFITLAEPTAPMKTEAIKAGFYETIFGKYAKIQIITVDELFAGKKPDIPLVDPSSYKKAPVASKQKQPKLF